MPCEVKADLTALSHAGSIIDASEKEMFGTQVTFLPP